MKQKNGKLHILRRVGVLALCLLLALSLLSVSAYGLEGSSGNLKWSLSGGTLTISGSGAMEEYTDAHMPPWYGSASAITRIVVEKGVTSVGSLAFYGCGKVTAASLPSTVTAIGDRAFKDCAALRYLDFPSSLTAIGEAAFEYCESLSGITLPEGLLTIGDYAFDRCGGLTYITIPSSVTSLGMVSFAYCTGLTQANILCPITKLPDWIFYGCTALGAVSLPETVTQTGDNAFHNCQSLYGVYYSGDAAESIMGSLTADVTTQTATVFAAEDLDRTSAGGSAYDQKTGTTITTTVSKTENAVITKKQETTHTTTPGSTTTPVTPTPDTTAPGTTPTPDTTPPSTGGSTGGTKTVTTISATVQNSDGWSEVAQAVNNELKNTSTETVKVEVQLSDSTVSGKDLGQLAGKDVTLSVSTSGGDTWVVDESKQTAKGFSSESYDLDFTVKKLPDSKTEIDSDTVYEVKFADSIDFDATVGINVKVGNAHQYATLYENKGQKATELQTVMVDANGNAWFNVRGVDKKSTYYVGINVSGVDTSGAVIPETLHAEYGIDDEYTLTDSAGTRYEVGERTSSWGITGKQFLIYAAIGLGVIVLVVTLIMVTLHKISKSKAKYAIPEPEDEAPLDEDAMRLQIMQEMLDDAQKNKSEHTNS